MIKPIVFLKKQHIEKGLGSFDIIYKIYFYASDEEIKSINNGQKTNVVGTFRIQAKTPSGYDDSSSPHNKVVENIKIVFEKGDDAVNKALDKLYLKHKNDVKYND